MTIRELAKLLDISPSAISIVLNGGSGVSEETRTRVMRAIKEYNYVPLVRKKSKNNNVLLMKFRGTGMFIEENQGFISMIIDAIEERLREEKLGMTMMVGKTDLDSVLKSIEYGKYCGMIIIATEIMEEDYGLLKTIPIPFVVVDNTMPNYCYSSVCMNNYENVWMALKYCKDCGQKEIGYLGSVTEPENFKSRYKAFRMYVEEMGLQFKISDAYHVKPTMLGAYEDFLKILEKNPVLPSCFFAENDTIALGSMKALIEKGYRIPDDISLIGFDDISYSSISFPALTTVHVQRDVIGKQAVYQLKQLIREPDFKPMKTRITGKLMIRDSVKKLKS